MKKSTYLWMLVALMVSACGASETTTFSASGLEASGEFLFEGPNTLQGPFRISSSDIASSVSIEEASIKEIKAASVSVILPADSVQREVESLLVQLVSDELPLMTVGTISPLNEGAIQTLSINEELDLLPYTKDPTCTLVVDTNLTTDKDDLTVTVNMSLNINY